MSQLRDTVVRSEKLVAEAGESSGIQRKREQPPSEAALKQRLVKIAKNLCVLWLQ
jgi:hypothetical protein